MTARCTASGIRFRVATDEDLPAIHRLNYATFADELGQYPRDASATEPQLVDKFHEKNTYFVAIRDETLVGMVAVHAKPPFSVTRRLPDPGLIRVLGGRAIEVRLLAIVPGHRNTTVFGGLLHAVLQAARRLQRKHLLISAIEQRLPLYRRFGFLALGPAVPDGSAFFVPMVLPLEHLPPRIERNFVRFARRSGETDDDAHAPRANPWKRFHPGPVPVARETRAAYSRKPIPHRSATFERLLARVRGRLREMTNCRRVALVAGGGTHANDALALSLRARNRGVGVVLDTGEFGARLCDHARRAGLRFHVLRSAWGRGWDLDGLDRLLASDPEIAWIWAVHHETSTGVLNPLPSLQARAAERNIPLCLDCVSSIGAVALDLNGIALASGSSGKALQSFAGLGFVLTGVDARSFDQSFGCDQDGRFVPSSLDIVSDFEARLPRFTLPSPPMQALASALDANYRTPSDREDTYERYRTVTQHLRRGLDGLGLCTLGDRELASPVITTIRCLNQEHRAALIKSAADARCAIYHAPAYLRDRGLLQVSTMGRITTTDCDRLLAAWSGHVGVRAPTGGPATANPVH